MPLTQRPTQLTQQGEGSSSHSASWPSEEDSYRNDFDSYSFTEEDDDDDWQDLEPDELHPSDSASTTLDQPPPRPRAGHRAVQRGRQVSYHAQHHPHLPPQQQQHHSHYRPAPVAPSTVDPADDYGHYGQGGHFQQPAHRGYFGGGRQHGSGYHAQQSHYMGGFPNGNQMVPFGNYPSANPFSPMSNGSNGASYFGGEPQRGMFDMMPFQQQGVPAYYGGAHHYNLPAHLQQFHISPPPPPPTDTPGQAKTPAPPEADPEKIRLEAELKAFKAQEEKVKAAEKQKEIEAQIRKDAEDAFQRRMDDIKKAQEEAKREIEKAKAEAELAARERIEAERKAEEERQKQHAEAMARAEENARKKFEAEMKAAEERRQKEEEERARAEEAAKIRLEKAIKAEADAKAAAEKKAAEEAERLKLMEEDARRKAESEAFAKVEAEKKAAAEKAEAEENAKKEATALKERIEEEAKAKFEEAARNKTDIPPITFKDAVNRKFSFPFHVCQTWQGMEKLIKQAFLQVDVLGPHVQEGHYDLIGPNGDIILPSVWEKVIEPDWTITMTMWPMEKAPPIGLKIPSGIRGGRRAASAERRHGAGIPPPPEWHGTGRRHRAGGLPDGIDIVNVVHGKDKKKDAKRNSTMLGFLAGKPAAKKKSSKK